MQILLDYIYKSELKLTVENVVDVFHAASMMLLDDVCDACVTFLKRCLTVENCNEIRNYAHQSNYEKLKEITDDFALAHFLVYEFSQKINKILKFELF